ncbi:nitroreductase/quinone reductase family protein [Nocardia sp. NPDC048505]|uniref:nitroreductase/quinone reductase family protein n=1 Tax=unclassified Nocardia TaxID=2637762 RepID=UPI00340E3C06
MSENEPGNAITEYDDPDSVITEFRENEGEVGGACAGAELILLTTIGAESGRPHVVPLELLRRPSGAGDILYVSSLIEDRYPAWYYNAKKNPRVTIEHGPEQFSGLVTVLEGAEYEEFAAWALAHNPPLAEHQAKVARPLPLAVVTFDK